MNYQKQNEAREVLDQLLNSILNLKEVTPPTYMDDGFRKTVVELYGVQYIRKNESGYEYEAIIFEKYKPSTSEVIFISNPLFPVIYEESSIKQISDTCIHFTLSEYYDPSIYDFSIDDLWL